MAKLRKGCLPQERNKLVTYLSRYEPETLTGNNGADSRRWGDKNKDAVADRKEAVEVPEEKDEEEEVEEEREEERDLDDDDPNKTWDFSSHGREELQHELARYLSRSGLDRQGEEEEEEEDSAGGGGGHGRSHGTAKQSISASASKAEGWGKGVRAQDRPRRAGEGDPAAAVAASDSIEAGERRKSREGGDGKAKIWSKGVLAKVTKARKGTDSGPRLAPAAIRSVKLERERRLQLEARERERELAEEEERLRSLPIPIGDGAGSAVIGGLEPLPNSREEDQLKHLSRLLWDGEEEPADFALTYGSRPRTSLQ